MYQNKNRRFYIKKKSKAKYDKCKIMNKIKIKVIDNPVQTAINNFNIEKGAYITIKANPDLIKRIVLNYIRHEYSNYEKISKYFNGNSFANRTEFKNNTNKKILKKYNYFKQELGNEIKRLLRKDI